VVFALFLVAAAAATSAAISAGTAQAKSIYNSNNIILKPT
jgi:hypothetical protein